MRWFRNLLKGGDDWATPNALEQQLREDRYTRLKQESGGRHVFREQRGMARGDAELGERLARHHLGADLGDLEPRGLAHERDRP